MLIQGLTEEHWFLSRLQHWSKPTHRSMRRSLKNWKTISLFSIFANCAGVTLVWKTVSSNMLKLVCKRTQRDQDHLNDSLHFFNWVYIQICVETNVKMCWKFFPTQLISLEEAWTAGRKFINVYFMFKAIFNFKGEYLFKAIFTGEYLLNR